MWARACLHYPAAHRGGRRLGLVRQRNSNSTTCCHSVLAALGCSTRLSSSTTAHGHGSASDEAYVAGNGVHVEHPIVQLPARSLWCKQYPLDPAHIGRGDFADMIERVQAARRHYQYPSLCAPQIGWNVRMFTLFDGTVFINPVNVDALELETEAKRDGISLLDAETRWMARLRGERKTCFAWEPCASCCFLMHYIERPTTVRVRAIGEDGRPFEVTLDKMRARMALHELDHLGGVLFTRRIPDTNHVVPLEGFSTMSDWSDDYPSLEARSTYLYTTFIPPYTFVTDDVEDAQLLDRKFEDGVYPGCEHERRMRIENAALEELQRAQWRMEKTRDAESSANQCMREAQQQQEEQKGENGSEEGGEEKEEEEEEESKTLDGATA